VNLDSIAGHWTFVFFGFTNCPDICPATLTQLVVLNTVLKKSGPDYPSVQFYFVSVDPERDTPEHLATYINYFDKSFVAVSGDMQELLAFEKQFGVFHRFVEQPGGRSYTVEHSADTFLIDPAGRIVARFQPPMDINKVASQYAEFVNYYGNLSAT
jgi:protein SCO1/2